MKEELYDDLFEEKEEKTDYSALLFPYLIRWPWIVASVVVCLALAAVYLHFATPVYNISATVLIKDDKKGGSVSSDLALFQDMGMFNSSASVDNEIEILRSKSLARKVVADLGLYIGYSRRDGFRHTDLYGQSPFRIDFPAAVADSLAAPILLKVTLHPDGSLQAQATQDDAEIGSARFDSLPAVLPTPAGTLTFLPVEKIAFPEQETVIDVTVGSPMAVAKGYAAGLTVEPTSKTTSVVTVSIANTNRRRGEDFINHLVENYNRDANNDKNEVARNTAHFIDERIAIINAELGTTEAELEEFKRRAGLTDLSSDAQLAVAEKSEYEKQVVANGTQLNLVNYLIDYLARPENAQSVLPANIGLTNTSVATLVTAYNERLIERQRLLRTSSESNPVIRRLDTELAGLRQSLTTSLQSARKELLITQADLDRQSELYAGRISDAPTQERQYMSIQRQQTIKADLYLMLLQKREENNITLAATANKAKIIDDAMAGNAPVSPKGKMIYLLALVAGIGLPVAVIYILQLLSFRIEGRADVERLTTVPILGDVPLSDEGQGPIAVRENENNLMTETFRNLRTNLLFLLDGPQKNVILVTSTMSGEGKTFIASNLAVSLALLGKKVIIVGLDIRKPGLNKVFHISHRQRGITQYLSAPQDTTLDELIQPSGIHPNLDLLPGGVVPPNPTELVARPALDDVIRQLRGRYDYVVLDTAPIGMVTDTQLIARTADISLYVCRADYTHKNDYRLINELQQQKRLPGLCTVINGLDMTQKKYGYYYGYGKYGRYYGYGKKYGYGYGYGVETEQHSKKK
ncbi:polysaccharide biosynthesis tyrosine autokinase [Mediterranea massiliensis]|uniref:GumC family protein n=1 Tax=Mediterranea massiliensis TaxID=1841865 RepID=UPI003209AE05